MSAPESGAAPRRLQQFAVYAERSKRGWRLRAYSLWYSATWSGFLGMYAGAGASRTARMKDAIRMGHLDLAAGKEPK